MKVICEKCDCSPRRVRIAGGMVLPYDPERDCRGCWLFSTSPVVNRVWGGDGNVLPAAPAPVQTPARQTARPPSKPCGGCGKGTAPLRVERQAKPDARSWSPPPKPAAETVPAGVVLGSYLWPELIDLQLRVIRRTLGDVPVLVVSDNPKDTGRLEMICRTHRAPFLPSTKRIGHCGGDLAVYYHGIRWAAGTGLKVLAKLSQRFVITRPGWLQEGAKDLLLSSLPAAGRWAEGTPHGPVWGQQLRTEAMLLDVRRWNRPEVLTRLEPRKRYKDRPEGYYAETQMLDLIKQELGGVYHPWGLVPPGRTDKSPDLLWHHANTREEYEALAAEYGVRLPADFTVEGWQAHFDRGEYDFG